MEVVNLFELLQVDSLLSKLNILQERISNTQVPG
jgi:hypothetical protein